MKALLTGISGQAASFLAELLLSKNYEVYGVSRRTGTDASLRYWRINHILKDITILSGSIESYASMFNIIQAVKPDELYHLAAQSFVADSFLDEFTTMRVNSDGTHNILNVLNNYLPTCRFYFAGSSEMFGDVMESPQRETTPFNPRSVYGISKCTGYYITKYYRTAYNLHASSGVMFNHESPRRGLEFVTRKIAYYAARIKKGLETKLPLGNIHSVRDWGHARDYVEAMWLMLQQEVPDDYVVATGKVHSVLDFCKLAFDHLDLNYEDYVVVDDKFKRPSDVNYLCGDASKAKKVLGWEANTSFEELVKEMVDAEMEALRCNP